MSMTWWEIGGMAGVWLMGVVWWAGQRFNEPPRRDESHSDKNEEDVYVTQDRAQDTAPTPRHPNTNAVVYVTPPAAPWAPTPVSAITRIISRLIDGAVGLGLIALLLWLLGTATATDVLGPFVARSAVGHGLVAVAHGINQIVQHILVH